MTHVPTTTDFEVVAALPTPFTESGTIDHGAYEAMLGQLDPYLDAALVLGTTGEFLALSGSERLELVDAAVGVLGADRVIGQIGSVSVTESLVLAEQVIDRGVGRIACLTPFYFPFTVGEVGRFFDDLRRELTGIDLYGYFFAERTGVQLSADDVVRMIVDCGLEGAKISGALTAQLPLIVAGAGRRRVYSGADHDPAGLRAAGAAGVVSGLSSVAPERYRELMSLPAGDPREPALRRAIVDLSTTCGRSLAHLKAGMRARTGHPWASRIPTTLLDPQAQTEIASLVGRLTAASGDRTPTG